MLVTYEVDGGVHSPGAKQGVAYIDLVQLIGFVLDLRQNEQASKQSREIPFLSR